MYIISQRRLKINTFANLFTLRTYENRLAREKNFSAVSQPAKIGLYANAYTPFSPM